MAQEVRTTEAFLDEMEEMESSFQDVSREFGFDYVNSDDDTDEQLFRLSMMALENFLHGYNNSLPVAPLADLFRAEMKKWTEFRDVDVLEIEVDSSSGGSEGAATDGVEIKTEGP